MKLISVQVGRPRKVRWRGRTVTTGIFKEPVAGRIMLRRNNLEGDGQGDLSVHGGWDKAVYVYPSEHYVYWRRELPGMELPYGSFGENFTTEGMVESSVRIGDRFRVGGAVVEVTQPRTPCYKLAVRFRRRDMPKRFHASGRCGFYLAVLEEGEIAAGDTFELIARNERKLSVGETYRRIFEK